MVLSRHPVHLSRPPEPTRESVKIPPPPTTDNQLDPTETDPTHPKGGVPGSRRSSDRTETSVPQLQGSNIHFRVSRRTRDPSLDYMVVTQY